MLCAAAFFCRRRILNALRFALRIFSGKIIFNRAMPERLRTLRHCIFTGGVVEENGICSAAFCESAALREKDSPSQSSPVGLASFLWEGAFGIAGTLPRGELSRSD